MKVGYKSKFDTEPIEEEVNQEIILSDNNS